MRRTLATHTARGAGCAPGPLGARRSSRSAIPMTRILLVDDHPIVRQGLACLVENEPDLRVTAEAETADGALAALDRGGVDFVLLDITLRQGSGLDLIGQIRARAGAPPILVLSMHHERFYAERALRAGAQGYIMKRSRPAELVPAIRKVLAGELYLSPTLSDGLMRRAVGGARGEVPDAEGLSDREVEVVRMIGGGRSTREIAGELGLSVKTIESYRANVKRKLNLRNGTELARFAYDWRNESIGASGG